MRDPNYYPESLKLIKEKSKKTRWGVQMPNNSAVLAFKDYFEAFIGHNKRVGFFQERQLLPNGYFDIETHAFINDTTKQVNAIAFSEKIDPSVNHSFVIRQPENVKKVSIAAYSFNDKCKPVLVNNFDPRGREHLNDFSIYNNIEKPYYEKYFELSSYPPHFHFNTQRQDLALDRPNAISIKNIIAYLNDLETQTQDQFLQTDTMGMPFLAIKNNDIGYLGVLRTMADKYSRYDNNYGLTDFFYDSMIKLNTTLEGCKESERDFKNLQIDMQTLNNLKKKFPKYNDVISDFGYHILSSLNQQPILDEGNPNERDRDRY